VINTHLKDTLKKGLVNNDILLAEKLRVFNNFHQPFMMTLATQLM